MTVLAKLNYQPLPLPRTSKLTRHYQSGDDGLTKWNRLFRYFCWLLKKYLLKLDITKFIGTSREKYFDFRKSLTPFRVLISDEDFGQVSLKSDKSIATYPINFCFNILFYFDYNMNYNKTIKKRCKRQYKKEWCVLQKYKQKRNYKLLHSTTYHVII